MKDSQGLPSRVAVDSSVLIAYFLGERAGRVVKERILGNARVEAFTSHLALSETFHILCRNQGEMFASSSMAVLENTGYLKTQESSSLDYSAAQYKCARKISLADCYVLAVARKIQGAALFATQGDRHRQGKPAVSLRRPNPVRRRPRLRSEGPASHFHFRGSESPRISPEPRLGGEVSDRRNSMLSSSKNRGLLESRTRP